MGNKTGITLEEALKMLEVANSIIQSQQKEITDQQIKIDAQKVLIQKKEEELSKTKNAPGCAGALFAAGNFQ